MAVVENVQMANFAVTTLAEDVSIAETDIDVTDASDFPTITGNQYYYLTIIRDSDNAKEIVKVTSVSSNTLTVTRAQDGTSALELLTGDAVELNVTTALLDDLRDEITAELNKISFADSGAVSHHDTSKTNTIAKFANDASDQILIVLGAGTYTFTDDYTVAKGVTLRFEGGAQLSVASGKTVTIKGQIVAPLEDLFTGAGDVDIASGQDVPAEWYGAVSYATTGEGSPVDSRAKISAAFTRVGGSRILLSAGYYYCTTSGSIGSTSGSDRSVVKINQGAYLLSNVANVGCDFEVIADRFQVFDTILFGSFISLKNSVVFPEWFGIDPDELGGADSTTPIQLAIDASEDESVIEFNRNWIYNVFGTLLVSSNKKFKNGEIWKLSSAGSIFHLDSSADNCVFEDMLMNISLISSGNASAIYANGADELSITNVKVISPRADTYSAGQYDSGIYLLNCDRCRISGCIVETPTKGGIVLEECENCLIDGCTVKTPTLVGIDIYNGVHNRVTNCTVKASTDMGIRVAGLSSGAGSVNTAIISNNNIQTSTQEGIVIDGVTANVDNILINGNMIIASSVSYTGIEFRGTVTDATVAANHIEGYDYGVGTTGATSNLLVAVNHLMGCTTETTIHSSSTNTQVLSNMKGALASESKAILVDQKSANTVGNTLTAGSWTDRDLNTIRADTSGMIVSLSSPNFTISAGTYFIEAYCPAANSKRAQSRLYNTTDSRVEATGLHVRGDESRDDGMMSVVSSVVVIGSDTAFKLQTLTENTGVTGEAWSDAALSDSVYTLVVLTKLSVDSVPVVDLSGENHWTYEFDASGGVAIGTHKIGELPNNAIVTRAWYYVEETFTSPTDAATISLGIESVDVAGIVAAKAISHVDNIWADAGAGGGPAGNGQHEAIQDGTVANNSNITDEVRDVQAIVAVENLTAGKLFLHLTFTVSE
jgi:parallel beta-helix repeat protein